MQLLSLFMSHNSFTYNFFVLNFSQAVAFRWKNDEDDGDGDGRLADGGWVFAASHSYNSFFYGHNVHHLFICI